MFLFNNSLIPNSFRTEFRLASTATAVELQQATIRQQPQIPRPVPHRRPTPKRPRADFPACCQLRLSQTGSRIYHSIRAR